MTYMRTDTSGDDTGQKIRQAIPLVLGLLVIVGVIWWIAAGPDADEDVQVIDLNRVLAIFDSVAGQQAGEAEAEVTSQALLNTFEQRLNEANLIDHPVGVQLNSKGEIEGWRNDDNNDVRGSGEPQLFTIAFDEQGQRVIASQEVAGETYHRDHYVNRYYGGHYYGRGLLGTMADRQDRYYTTAGQPRPNYSAMSMASPGYHGSAVNRARAAAGRTARSTGGSRGFSFGK